MIAREEPLLDAREPVLRAIVLAFRTVPVPTGVIAILERSTVVALVERPTEHGRATLDDVVERAALGRQEHSGIRVGVRRPDGANDVRQLEHASPRVGEPTRAALIH